MEQDLEVCIWKSMLKQEPIEKIKLHETEKHPLLLIGDKCKVCYGYDSNCIYYKPGEYCKDEDKN